MADCQNATATTFRDNVSLRSVLSGGLLAWTLPAKVRCVGGKRSRRRSVVGLPLTTRTAQRKLDYGQGTRRPNSE
eukprot:432016-Amphidinium_carterae.3